MEVTLEDFEQALFDLETALANLDRIAREADEREALRTAGLTV